MTKNICQQCGYDFKGHKGNSNKFCSYQCYWDSKKHKEARKCSVCGKFYMAVLSKKGDFCSRSCFLKYQKNSVDVACKMCGKIVHKWKSQIYPSGNIYCSRECSTNAVRKPGWNKTSMFRVQQNIRRAIGKALAGNKNGRHWETLVGYTLKKLKRHLEEQFTEGMTWDNYGIRGWHIDHIIPRTAFNFSKSEHIDFKRCWALKNLRPMWFIDNIRKSNKIDKPFQPCLEIEIK